jgi:hypothetical protein
MQQLMHPGQYYSRKWIGIPVQRCSNRLAEEIPPLVILPRLSYDDHLLNLPSVLYREILQYLIINDLCNLESALVKQQLRECYLSAISGMVASIPLNKFLNSRNLSKRYFNWLSKRNIRFKCIDYCSCNKEGVLKVINQSNRHLETLEFHPFFEDTDLQVIGSCPRLQFLSFLEMNAPIRYSCGGLEDFLRMNPQLQSLSIQQNTQFSDRLLEVLFEACPHLTQLDLSNCSWVTDASLDMISNCA